MELNEKEQILKRRCDALIEAYPNMDIQEQFKTGLLTGSFMMFDRTISAIGPATSSGEGSWYASRETDKVLTSEEFYSKHYKDFVDRLYAYARHAVDEHHKHEELESQL